MTRESNPHVLGIIGVGAIAAAIVEGLCALEPAPVILLSPRSAERAAALARRFATVEVADDNQAVIARASTVILSVRPQDAEAILGALRFLPTQAVISVMAGVSLERVRRLVAPARDISRAIPLPTVAHHRGLTPIYPVTQAAKVIFGPLGGTLDLADETAFEALSAASGTVAAHLAYLDAIAGWLAARQVPDREAQRFVASIFAGLAHDLDGAAPDFGRLARDHATAGGINEQFRRKLETAGLFDTMTDGLDELLERLVRPSERR